MRPDGLAGQPSAIDLLHARAGPLDGGGGHPDDIIAVDRALEHRHGCIVVAVVDNEFTCKKLCLRGGHAYLEAAHPAYPDIHPGEGQTLEVWGVVTAALTLFPH